MHTNDYYNIKLIQKNLLTPSLVIFLGNKNKYIFMYIFLSAEKYNREV